MITACVLLDLWHFLFDPTQSNLWLNFLMIVLVSTLLCNWTQRALMDFTYVITSPVVATDHRWTMT